MVGIVGVTVSPSLLAQVVLVDIDLLIVMISVELHGKGVAEPL